MFGLDHLGLAKYGKLALAEHPNGWALGAFSNVSGFGDALPAVKAILDSGRCPRVRLHLYWSDRTGHAPESNYLSIIEKEARRVGKFYAPYASRINCRVSAYCESPRGVDGAKLRALVMKYMPQGVEYVHSYDLGLGGKPLANCINEVHGSTRPTPSGRFDFSFDGENCFDTDITVVKNKFARAETFYLWIPQCNGNKNMKREDTLPRPQRTFYPTSRHIDAMIYQSHDLSGWDISNKITFKPVSDQHTNPPTGKDCKPVIITPVGMKPNAIYFRAANGQVIDTAPYFDTFNEKNPDGSKGKLLGYRYYFSDWGYLLCEKSRRIQNTVKCEVWADKKKIGVVVPATRAGKPR